MTNIIESLQLLVYVRFVVKFFPFIQKLSIVEHHKTVFNDGVKKMEIQASDSFPQETEKSIIDVEKNIGPKAQEIHQIPALTTFQKVSLYAATYGYVILSTCYNILSQSKEEICPIGFLVIDALLYQFIASVGLPLLWIYIWEKLISKHINMKKMGFRLKHIFCMFIFVATLSTSYVFSICTYGILNLTTHKIYTLNKDCLVFIAS